MKPRTLTRTLSRSALIATVGLPLSPWTFAIYWVTFLLLHSLAMLQLLGFGVLYYSFSGPTLDYYVYLLGLWDQRYFRFIAAFWGLLGVAHLYGIARMLYFSIRNCSLLLTSFPKFHVAASRAVAPRVIAVRPAPKSKSSNNGNTAPSDKARTVVIGTFIRRSVFDRVRCGWRRMRLEVRACVAFFVGIEGILNVESDWFEVVFIAREVVEVAVQTAQVYSLSELVARVWLNNFVVGLVVVNCWSTPFLQHFFSRDPAFERGLCLTIDMLLVFLSSVLIPLLNIYPYVAAFDTTTMTFPDELVYNEKWLVAGLMEAQQALFIRSGIDMLGRVIAHVSMLINAFYLRSILRNRRATRIWSAVAVAQPLTSAVSRTSSGRSQQSNISTHRRRRQPYEPFFVRVRRRAWFTSIPKKFHNFSKLVHASFAIWGAVVLMCHLFANQMRETPAGIVCRLHTFPWFISSYTCSVIELNCRRIGTDGNAKDLEKVLTLVKHDLIFYVAFTHCPALEIPSTIQEFRNLKGIEVYNSTIVDWPEEASLQQDLHPYLSVLYMARVNMSELPTGLQHPQFPRSLMDIEMCMVNLTTLPEVIIGRWPRRLTFLYWEMSGLRQIPSVVGELQVDQLSFSGNDIREVPDVIFASQHLQVVSFAANRELAVIPSDMGDISLLYEVLLDYTSVAALPTWLTPSFASSLGTNVSASATPFCGQQFEDIGGVHCALLQYDTISLYPIEIKDAQRST